MAGDRRQVATDSGGNVAAILLGRVETNRDAWVYNFPHDSLSLNVSRLIENYSLQLEPFAEYCRHNGITRPNEGSVTEYLARNRSAADERKIKWSRPLRNSLARGVRVSEQATRSRNR